MTSSPLDADRWNQAKVLFDAALLRPVDELEAWLRDAARGDEDLIQTVLRLLEADGNLLPEPQPATGLLSEYLSDTWPAGTRIGAYLIERRLGRGGMGEVYLARRADDTVVHQVAIKRLRADAAHPDLRRRFMAERRILARLEHPHIARFIDAGADDSGRPYAVMEYVEGRPITDHVKSANLDIESLLRLFLKVVDAVSHAHRQLVVHRDIKPENVLVDAHGEPRLLDFGIAKTLIDDTDSARAQTQTAFDLRCFSLRYAAPEQLRPGPIDTSCDVYALGALLFELLTGRPPFDLEGLSYGEAERVVLQQEPPSPSRLLVQAGDQPRARRVRGDLDRIVLHALRKASTERYASAEALGLDLRRVLELRPISLPTPQPWYPAARFVRRHWVPVSLGSLATLTLVLGSLLLYMQSVALAEQRDTALSAALRAEAVTALMVDAFDAADPSRNRGEKVLARDVLDIAALRLRTREDLDRRSIIELNSRLSEVMLSVGHRDAALEAATRAMANAGAETSGELLVTAGVALARVQIALRDLDAAEATLNAIASRIEDTHFESPAAGRHAQVEIGMLRVAHLAAEGRQIDAADLAEEIYRLALGAFGSSHTLTRKAGTTYLERLLTIGRTDDVEPLAEALAEGLEELELDAEGRRVLSAQVRILRRQGRHADAFTIHERLLRSAERLYGTNHPAYAQALGAAAGSAAAAGRPELANEFYRAAIDLYDSLGGDDPMLAGVLNNYAGFLLRLGEANALAEASARRAVALADATLPDMHTNRAFLRLTLGHALQTGDKHGEAIEVLGEAERIFVARGGGSSVAEPRAHALGRMATSALALGDPIRARHFRDAAEALRAELPDGRALNQETEALLSKFDDLLRTTGPGPDQNSLPPTHR